MFKANENKADYKGNQIKFHQNQKSFMDITSGKIISLIIIKKYFSSKGRKSQCFFERSDGNDNIEGGRKRVVIRQVV